MMEEAKLYCPDFRSIFGKKYANPFWFPNIDAQLWPILSGISFPDEITKLLSLNRNKHPLFYIRKITIEQLLLELDSGDLGIGIVQALEIGREYGIPNSFTIKIAKKSDNLSSIISVTPSIDSSEKIKKLQEEDETGGNSSIVAVVIYPQYKNIDLLDERVMERFCKDLSELNLPLKIDVSDLHLPNIDYRRINPDIISTFISNAAGWAPSLNIIIAGASFPVDLSYYVEKLKYYHNVYLELSHRSIGGTSSSKFFENIINLPGFVQNWWSKILLSSGTPTLEPSQLMRGWIEATDTLTFAQRSLLRSWGFRNGWRIYGIGKKIPPYREQERLFKAIEQRYELKSQNIVNFGSGEIIHLGYDIILQSFSITQLMSFFEILNSIIQEVLQQYPKISSGDLTLKSYHTTTSIIMNEHEFGNYLQLHYYFAEKTRENPDDKLHTVAAFENRADFNFPDHLLASSFGQRSITVPIRNGKVSLGSREHLYALITFGPREIRISADFSLQTENA